MVSNERYKQISKYLVGIIGGEPRFEKFLDKKEESSVVIMKILNRPEEGVCSYSTIGLYEHPIGLKYKEQKLRVEFLLTLDQKETSAANILATSAFHVINSGHKCYPGVIFHDIVGMYRSDTQMKHIMFTSPFLWDEKLKGFQIDDMVIEWLLAVPISENECKYAEEFGSEALEDLFEQHGIDIFTLERVSIL